MKRVFRLCLKIIPTLLTIAIIAVFLLQKVDHSEGSSTITGSPLLEAWQESGAPVTEAGVNGWVCVENEFMTVGDLCDHLRKMASSFGAHPKENELKTVDELGFRMVDYTGEYGDAILRLNAQSLSAESGWKLDEETYLSAEVWGHTWDKLGDYENAVSSALQGRGKPDLTTTLVGRVQGKLSFDAQREIIERVFGKLDAKQVEEMKDASLLSVSGYSHLLDREIIVDKKPINLQMAFTYDEGKGETVIMMASPVILMEY